MPEKQAVFFPTFIIAVLGTPVNPALNFFLQAVPMDCFSFFEKNFQNRVRIPSVFRIEGEEDKTASHKNRKPLALQARRGVPGIQAAFQIQKTKEK